MYNKVMKKTLITLELFLTLLVVVLFGFLLFIFTNSRIKDEASVPVVSVDTKELYCGISVTSPAIESLVSLPLSISGYVSGCGWEPYLNYVAKLKIMDSEGNLIGRPFLVNKNLNSSSPVSSQFNLIIKDLPIETGEVKLFFESLGGTDKKLTVPVKIVSKVENETLE